MHTRNICSSLFIILLAINSCQVENFSSETINNELKVKTSLVNYTDSTSSKKVFVSLKLVNYYDVHIISLGHCWNYNIGNEPDLDSDKEIYDFDNILENWDYEATEDYCVTGIPVSDSIDILYVRAFVVFNDNLIRYSETLEIINPLTYAK